MTRKLKVVPGAADLDVEESECFRVMSFNMLAQQMANSKMFKYVPQNQLRKRNRWPRVRAEVSRYGADIICLQECDLYDQILTSLQEHGEQADQGTRFEGVYKRRNNDGQSHGVAILYDSQVFRLLDSGSCEYGERLMGGVGAFALLEDRRQQRRRRHPTTVVLPENDEIVGTTGVVDGTMGSRSAKKGPLGEQGECGSGSGAAEEERVRAAAAAATEDDPSGLVCVATTHLYWHPDGGAIRLAQAETLMAHVASFLHERFGNDYSTVPVVLAGDLNTVPGVDVYRLLSERVFKGEKPEAFHRRRHERARAKEADKVEKARQYNAKLEAIRAKNAAVISAARSSTSPDALREVVHDIGGAAEAADGTVEEVASVEATQGRGGTPVSIVQATDGGDSVTQGRAADSAGLTLTVSDDNTAAAASSSAKGGGELTPASHEREGGPDQDDDVRRYKQEFRGFSSAYGAYSSVFDSQLSRNHPPAEYSASEAAGTHKIGIVRLGARTDGGGSLSQNQESVRPQKSQHQQQHQQGNGPSGEPQFTTCTDSFAGTIDYIWHNRQLQVRSLLGLPSFKQATYGKGLPTASYPSDHVSIMAELFWRHPAQTRGEDAPAKPQ
ncbi:unnamed protein product [Ectocarpus fasciculatus]